MAWRRSPDSPVAAGDARTLRVHIHDPGDDGFGGVTLEGDDLSDSIPALPEPDLQVLRSFEQALDDVSRPARG